MTLKVNVKSVMNVHLTIMYGGISVMGLFMATAGLAATYGVAPFGPVFALLALCY